LDWSICTTQSRSPWISKTGLAISLASSDGDASAILSLSDPTSRATLASSAGPNMLAFSRSIFRSLMPLMLIEQR